LATSVAATTGICISSTSMCLHILSDTTNGASTNEVEGGDAGGVIGGGAP